MNPQLAELLDQLSSELARAELSDSRRHACVALLDAVAVLAQATDTDALREAFHCARAATTVTRIAVMEEARRPLPDGASVPGGRNSNAWPRAGRSQDCWTSPAPPVVAPSRMPGRGAL